MTSFKCIIRTIVAVFILTFFTAISHAEVPVQFSWAVLTDTETGLRPLDFSTTPVLKSGTTLQIYLEQKPGTFIYIYLVDSTGGLTFIFPGDPKHYNSTTPTDQILRIPPDTARFELMPPDGQEKLYLLASSTRLTKLESLTEKYQKKRDDKELRADVLKELKLLRRKHSSLAQKTETSVPVAGTIRTRGNDTGSFDAVQVNSEDFYSRILRINHE